MGLLDDAIREHIDLLRRRGADPTDIAKAEAEALGPVVREVAQPEHHAEDEALLAGTQPVPAPETESFDVEFDDEGVPFEDEALPVDAEAPAPAAFVDEPTQQFQAITEEDPEVEVAIESGDFDDPSLHAPDAATSDDDVLEGTPDFLAETPDHERLWFEQAPPKDFDFDGEE
ncbi:MAG: hypothetical protein NTY57_01510 [Solirubrobacterales bacterium]|nr:hypothetical protein [Solirubrobacterales bacterium]